MLHKVRAILIICDKIICVFLAFLRFFLYLCERIREVTPSRHPASQRQEPKGLSLLMNAARHSHERHKTLPRPPQEFATGGAN